MKIPDFPALLHQAGIWMTVTSLIAYWLLRYRKQDFITEGYRAYFRRRFTPLGLFGFVLIFGTGMAMIITHGFAGSKKMDVHFMVKMSGVLAMLITGLCLWGIDAGIVKRIDEMKHRASPVPVNEMHQRIGGLNRLMNVFVIITFLILVFIYAGMYW